MAMNALRFVLETLGQLWILAVLLRFFAQAVKVGLGKRSGNPLAEFIMALTDWAVLPLRRIVPSAGRFDSASFVVAWLASILLSLAIFALIGQANVASPFFWPALIFYGFVEVIQLTIYLYIAMMIIQAILSWVSPYHPLQPFFNALTRPLLRPIQRVIPLIGGVDLSPLFVIILLQVMLIFPVAYLALEAKRLVLGAM
jgi:YggT family protein